MGLPIEKIPKTKTIIFPLLELLEDKKDYILEQVIIDLSIKFSLSENDLKLKVDPMNTKTRALFHHNILEAVSILKKRKLLEHQKLAVFHITDLGLKHLYYLRGINRE